MTLEVSPPRNIRALALSLFLIFSLFSLCGLSILLIAFTIGLPEVGASEQLTFSLLAGGLFFSAILLLPAIFINVSLFLRWTGLNVRFPPVHESVLLLALGILWSLTLVLGQIVALTPFAVIALPLLNILAVTLPIIFFLRIALRKLEPASAQQTWSVFAVTSVTAPILAMLLEALALVIFLLVAALFASIDADLTRQLTHLLQIAEQGSSSDALTTAVMPMLFTPIGLLIIFGLFAVAVPIIEETIKVMALWLFADQIKHPVQGFALGALCGAAFALAENVGFSSTGANDWMQSVMERATAILPHTLNSGILGWALVSAWKERAYFKLGGAYFAVILIHGVWNAISIALALSTLTMYADQPVLSIFASSIPFSVGQTVMMLGTFGGLIFCNTVLRRSQPAQAEYNVPPALPNSPDNGETHGIS